MNPYFNCFSIILGWLILFSPIKNNHPSSLLEVWSFKKEKEGIRVFTRVPTGQDLKELKITFTVNASLTTIAAVLRDVPKMTEWVYKCAHAEILENINDKESIEYYKMDFPWPMTDRDLVVKAKIFQDPKSGELKSITQSFNNYKPANQGLVRITEQRNDWIFKPISPNLVEVTYFLSAHPAGSIPDWLVNMVVDQGPVQSMQAFRKLLQEDTYRNVKISGIKNY